MHRELTLGEDVRLEIDIDDNLLAEAGETLGTGTAESTVEAALTLVVKRHAQRRIMELCGTVEWVGDLDEMRRDRFPGEWSPTSDEVPSSAERPQ